MLSTTVKIAGNASQTEARMKSTNIFHKRCIFLKWDIGYGKIFSSTASKKEQGQKTKIPHLK